MQERVRDPEPKLSNRPRAEPATPEHDLLALQRRFGNQAVARMLHAGGTLARKGPEPSHAAIDPVTEIYGGTNADVWATELREHKHDIRILYSELATLLHATAVEDVKGTKPDDINGL